MADKIVDYSSGVAQEARTKTIVGELEVLWYGIGSRCALWL